jgi:ectoine hydroxylase-related dioxygenase (phytanoyl-CoA dioxygenase family)
MPTAGWVEPDDCCLDDFRSLVEQATDLADYPLADAVEQNVLVYGERLRAASRAPDTRRAAQAELARALLEGPGVLMFKQAFETSVVDRATEQFEAMIAEQKQAGLTAGDHFAKPGANDRVWGALDKLALRAPDVFVDYYANDTLALICEAWLGPGYQITSQVNVVNPGGDAQRPHRDYHLGFTTDERAAEYPPHVHRLSPALTLQGAVAHCDMPVETGPTMYLPHSQKYVAGYMAWRRPEFVDYFDEHHVQLPLAAGDAVFFNPALFHAAGTNRTADVRRMANLLQISSAFGRAMEAMDREVMVNAVYPALVGRRAGGLDDAGVANVVAACAEGYAFPTDLDRDQPVEGLSPPSQADVVRQALGEGWPPERLRLELVAHTERRRPC